jgi:hypothetical protein
MQGTYSSRGKRIYRCVMRHAGGVCPAPARIKADVVEAFALDAVRGATVRRERSDRAPLEPLEEAWRAAERRLAQVMTDEARDALGDMWAADVKARRTARDEAASALGEARAQSEERRSFRDMFRKLDVDTATRDEIRQAIAGLFLYLAVDRDKTIHWPPGDGDPPAPTLSRRGFNREAALNPLPPYPAKETR